MASCTRIENSLQAYIDGELGDSDRVILEEHVAECAACAAQLRTHQRTSAMLFEAFSTDRLEHSLCQRILNNLPEIEIPEADLEIEEVNWRAKHPDTWTNRLAHLVPVAAVAILIFLTVVLRFSYPEHKPYTDIFRAERQAVGVVTYAPADVVRIPAEATQRQTTRATAMVRPGDRFETRPGTGMMLSLAGPTVVKLDGNTRLKVSDARRISVEEGTIWVDVAHDGSLFKVITPAGLVTVFGTAFSVRVAGNQTTITVERGNVQVESGEHLYRLMKDQQVVVSSLRQPTGPVQVEAAEIDAWANGMIADPKAEALFVEAVQSKVATSELTGRLAFVIDTMQKGQPRQVDAIRIYWQPGTGDVAHNSYEVTISDGSGRLLHEAHLDGAIFTDPNVEFYEIALEEPIRDVRTLVVRLIPDQTTDGFETDSFEVKAQAKVESSS